MSAFSRVKVAIERQREPHMAPELRFKYLPCPNSTKILKIVPSYGNISDVAVMFISFQFQRGSIKSDLGIVVI